MNKKLKILFTGSIVVNVLLMGIVGGMVYRHTSAHSWHQVRQSLAPETKHVMGRVFQKNFKELKPVITEARGQKKALMQILTAAEFDRDAFESGAKKLQKLQGKIRGAKVFSMGELAASLPLEEREKLSVLFKKSLSERDGPRRKHKRHDRGQKHLKLKSQTEE